MSATFDPNPVEQEKLDPAAANYVATLAGRPPFTTTLLIEGQKPVAALAAIWGYIDDALRGFPGDADTGYFQLRITSSQTRLVPNLGDARHPSTAILAFDSTSGVLRRCLVTETQDRPDLGFLAVPSGVIVLCQPAIPLEHNLLDTIPLQLYAHGNIYGERGRDRFLSGDQDYKTLTATSTPLEIIEARQEKYAEKTDRIHERALKNAELAMEAEIVEEVETGPPEHPHAAPHAKPHAEAAHASTGIQIKSANPASRPPAAAKPSILPKAIAALVAKLTQKPVAAAHPTAQNTAHTTAHAATTHSEAHTHGVAAAHARIAEHTATHNVAAMHGEAHAETTPHHAAAQHAALPHIDSHQDHTASASHDTPHTLTAAHDATPHANPHPQQHALPHEAWPHAEHGIEHAAAETHIAGRVAEAQHDKAAHSATATSHHDAAPHAEHHDTHEISQSHTEHHPAAEGHRADAHADSAAAHKPEAPHAENHIEHAETPAHRAEAHHSTHAEDAGHGALENRHGPDTQHAVNHNDHAANATHHVEAEPHGADITREHSASPSHHTAEIHTAETPHATFAHDSDKPRHQETTGTIPEQHSPHQYAPEEMKHLLEQDAGHEGAAVHPSAARNEAPPAAHQTTAEWGKQFHTSATNETASPAQLHDRQPQATTFEITLPADHVEAISPVAQTAERTVVVENGVKFVIDTPNAPPEPDTPAIESPKAHPKPPPPEVSPESKPHHPDLAKALIEIMTDTPL